MLETAEQYQRRMLGYSEGQDPLKLEAAAPAKLAKLLKGVSGGGFQNWKWGGVVGAGCEGGTAAAGRNRGGWL